MFLVPLVQFAVCYLILVWLLKKKPGERFSKKTVAKFLLSGALSAVACFLPVMFFSFDRDSFFGMNPILSGFLTALITAALLEEILKYIFFRLAVRKNREVVCWLDAIIAAVAVGIGFTLLEDLTYLFDGAGSIFRVLLPGHLLFQAIMGYYYGKARVTKQLRYDVLSLAVPVLAHTLFDMFLAGMMSIVGSPEAAIRMSEEEIRALPYANYMVPMLVCAIAVFVITFAALIVTAIKISRWSKRGEKQELLQAENA